jgi:hypothetical protein
MSMDSTQSVESLRNYKQKTDHNFVIYFYKIFILFFIGGSISVTQEEPRGGGPLFASHQ